MSREDIRRFYAVTPVWLWPVLWWNLQRLLRVLDDRALHEAFLVRVLTDGRGRLKLDYIARPERLSLSDLSHMGPSIHELFDLDVRSFLMDAARLMSARALACSLSGATLARLIGAVGFPALPEPEPG